MPAKLTLGPRAGLLFRACDDLHGNSDASEYTEYIEAETAHLAKLRQQKQGLMHDLLTAHVPVPA